MENLFWGRFLLSYFTILGILQLCWVQNAGALPEEDNNPYRHEEVIDPNGKYLLEWLVNWEEKRIFFNVTVETKGYVGFGISSKGKMSGADIVIGGVDSHGRAYFTDRHAIGNQIPEIDDSQDWTLHNAWERHGRTFLSFSRAFDTCDEHHDLPITNDVQTVIWAYGEVDDEIQYHFQNRGAYPVYLLDPDLAPRNLEEIREGEADSNMEIFNITTRIQTIGGQDTMYWCSFHKVPTTRREHIIGFNTAFPTDRDRSHVHHLLLHRCKAPPGISAVEFFDGAARSGGTECYVLDRPHPLPVPYCRETIHVWGVGGKPIFFPEHAGLPMLASEDEYFMLQVHYDTPLNISTNVTVSLELYHTSKLREFEVGTLQLGDLQPGSTTLIVPPSSTSHIIHGHCAPGCTKRIFDPKGINIFAVFLHTHISGRGMRALHFRGDQEFPWIQADDNYNFDYQQFRVLRQERKVLPGDTLVIRCNYASTNRNGTVVYGGFSTREEMCSSFMYYYSRSPGFSLCRSEIRDERYFDFLGIRNMTWNQSIRQMVITSPPEYAGMSISHYLNFKIKWDLKTRETLQRLQTYLPQVTACPRFYWEDPQEQLERQLQSGILERTGRLPGSDGRAFVSVDEDGEHESILPRNVPRYSRPSQCTRKNPIIKNHVPVTRRTERWERPSVGRLNRVNKKKNFIKNILKIQK